ncbi:hypothetical protein HOJ01_00535 [bacterium]|mgnify:FL=1|jgi:hypothetical protein|nr:hypothetical protein [bacterium]MBT6293275.1 hypothetical protein [bacterium]
MLKKIIFSFLAITIIIASQSYTPTNAFAENKKPASVDFLENELKPRYLPEITDPKISTQEKRSGSGDDSQSARKKTERFVGDLIVTALQFLGGSIVLLIIIYAFKMVIAFGNEEEITNSKKALGNLALGLLIIMLSYSITLFILDLTLIPQELEGEAQTQQTPATQETSSTGENNDSA